MNNGLEDRVEALEKQVTLLTAEVEGHRRQVRPQLAPYPTPRRDTGTGTGTGTFHVYPKPSSPHALDIRVDENDRIPLAPPPPRRERVDLEELLGGRLLALVGGVAVIVGLAFFVALAVNHGWIGVTARMVLAALGSSGLLAAGVWLYERHGRSQAALAMVGTALTCGFLTLATATAHYGLVPTPAALPLALAIGAVGTAVAVRWNSPTVAGLGIGGTLAAPLLAGSLTTAAMTFLAVAGASAAAVLIWRRWPWLAVGTSVLMLGQLALWTVGQRGTAELVCFLGIFAALNLLLALGYELRDSTAVVQPWAVLLATFSALILGALGYYSLPHGSGELAGGRWLIGLACAHAVVAGIAIVLRRVSEEIALVLFGIAFALGDVAFGSLGSGWVLAVGWAGSAVGLAVLARRQLTGSGRDCAAPRDTDLLQLTLGAQLALAVGHVLLFDARPELLATRGVLAPGATTAIVAVMVAAFASARLVVDEGRETRIVLDGLTMAALAYVTALTLDGSTLLLAWAAASVALARAAGQREDLVAEVGAYGFLALIVGHAVALDAPPSGLVYGVDSPAGAALALALVAAVSVLCARVDHVSDWGRSTLGALTAVALLYLGSTLIVTAFQPSTGAIVGSRVGVRQQGQALLSAFWGLSGITALWVGLRLDSRVVRLAGLGLLSLAAAKVFLYDLSALGSVYRVASFIVLGLLLLAAAFVHQRLRAKTEPLPPSTAV
jgi:uncharacterized membrane protein